jgi:raffinose/stachyose/melibiose transport system permease protein
MTDFAETAPVDAATAPSEGRRLGAGARTYLYVSLILVAALVLVPLIATALGGFKTLGDLRANPFGLPSQWMWSNYTDIIVSQRYWLQMGNSLWIAVLTVILTLALSGMAAFVFAHVKFFGSDYLLNYFLIGLMFPAATAILPLFIRIRDLGLLDTYMGVVLPQVAFHLGVSILLLRNYFRNLPAELFDAAFVDGCGYIGFFWHVTLPLSRPIIATVGIISFVASWNSYIIPLIMLNTESRYPWPLGIMVYKGEFSTEWQLVLAFITLTILPTVIAFFVAQKHIIAGLTAGAVKS